MSLEQPNLPYVGQILDYYPDDTTRYAAICTEVHPNEDITARPKVNLAIFMPDATMAEGIDIDPVEQEESAELATLKERWGFAHEFNLKLKDASISSTLESENPLGTETNIHVGSVTLTGY